MFTNMGSPVRDYYIGLQVTPALPQMWKTQRSFEVVRLCPLPALCVLVRLLLMAWNSLSLKTEIEKKSRHRISGV